MKHQKIEFECRLCKETNSFTEPKFIAHLDIEHSDIKNNLRTGLVYDFNIEKLRNEIEIKLIELTELKKNLNELRNGKKNIELNELKIKVLKSLENTDIDSNSLEIINTRKSIHKLKVYLYRGLKKKYRVNLENFGIDYKVPLTKIKKKPKNDKKKKLKKEKQYYDKTTSSVRTIYTPMGNKR